MEGVGEKLEERKKEEEGGREKSGESKGVGGRGDRRRSC